MLSSGKPTRNFPRRRGKPITLHSPGTTTMAQPRSPQPPAPYPEEVPRTPLRTRFDLDGGRALELGKFYQVGTGTGMGTEAPRVFQPRY